MSVGTVWASMTRCFFLKSERRVSTFANASSRQMSASKATSTLTSTTTTTQFDDHHDSSPDAVETVDVCSTGAAMRVMFSGSRSMSEQPSALPKQLKSACVASDAVSTATVCSASTPATAASAWIALSSPPDATEVCACAGEGRGKLGCA